MEAVILSGIQGSGKTTFYAERFLATHVRISRDLLRTPHRERRFLDLCLETRQPLVVDKINPTRAHRRPYVEACRAAGFRTVACWLDVAPREAVARNARREGATRVPVPAILGTHKHLEPPALDEGFAEVWRVRPAAPGGFVIDRAGSEPRWSRGVAAAG